MEPPRIPDHELLRLIGRGSYGEVWLARNALGTPRAVKIVYRDAFDSARPYEREFTGIQRFEPISRSHEGLVDILQVGRNDEAGCFYYVMELADPAGATEDTTFESLRSDTGFALHPPAPTIAPEEYVPRTLGEDLKRRPVLPPADCLPLFLSLASALGHLHRHGLVHRDIKPSNIIFVNRTAKLADIGLVAEATEAASFVGTEGFIPPEGPGTRQADIYSLGKVYYEVATGKDRTEFPSLPVELEDLASHRELLELNAVIVKCCASDPKLRYQTAEELASDIALLQSGRSVKRMRQVEVRLARFRRVLTLAALVTVVAVAVSAVARVQAGKDRALRGRAEVAEQGARAQLWRARVNEARALRMSGHGGVRQGALAALKEAARVRIDGELRSEAAACLALLDFQDLPDRPGPIPGPGTNLMWSPRADRYLLSAPDGSMTVHSAADGTLLSTLPGPGKPASRLQYFSPGGRWLFAVYSDGNDAVWDTSIASGGKPHSLPYFWEDFAFSANDRFAFFAETNGALHCVALEGWNETVERFPFAHYLARPNPDASRLALAPYRLRGEEPIRAVEIWDRLQHRQVTRLELPAEVQDLRWLDDERLAICTADNLVRIRHVASAVPELVLVGHQSRIIQFDALRQTDWFLTRGWDGTERLWSLHDGREVLRLLSDREWQAFDPESRQLTVNDERAGHWVRTELVGDRVVRNLAHARIEGVNGPFFGNFDRSSQWFVSNDADGTRIWSVAGGQLALKTNLAGSCWFHVSRDVLLVAGGDRDTVEIPWKIGASNHWNLGQPIPRGTKGSHYLTYGTNDAVGWVAPAPGGKVHFRMRIPGRTNDLQWTSGEGGIPALAANLSAFVASTDGRWFATSTRFDHAAWLMDAESGTVKATFKVRFGAQMYFLPNNEDLVVGDGDEYRLWNIAAGTNRWVLRRPPTSNLAGREAATHDSRVLALAADRHAVLLVSARDGRELLRLEHPAPEHVSGLCFSPDSRYLAVLNETHVTHLWDLRTLRGQLAELGFGWDPELEEVGR